MKRYLDLCHRFQVADEAQVSHAELDEQHHHLAEFEGYTDDHFGLDDMTFGVQPLPEFAEMLAGVSGQAGGRLSPWSLRLGSHTFTQTIGMCGPLELVHISGDGTFRLRVVGDTVARLDRFAQNGLPDENSMGVSRAKPSEDVGRRPCRAAPRPITPRDGRNADDRRERHMSAKQFDNLCHADSMPNMKSPDLARSEPRGAVDPTPRLAGTLLTLAPDALRSRRTDRRRRLSAGPRTRHIGSLFSPWLRSFVTVFSSRLRCVVLPRYQKTHQSMVRARMRHTTRSSVPVPLSACDTNLADPLFPDMTTSIHLPSARRCPSRYRRTLPLPTSHL